MTVFNDRSYKIRRLLADKVTQDVKRMKEIQMKAGFLVTLSKTLNVF